MARTKRVNDIPLQLNLSTKRLFDAHLILAISDYLNDKNNKMTKLLKSLVDKAMDEDDKYPHFSSLEFDENIEFPSYFPKTKRVVVVFTDSKQIDFLLEVQKKIKLTDYARYLFLKYFYEGDSDRNQTADESRGNPKGEKAGGAEVELDSTRPVLSRKESVRVQKKKIIEPMKYVEKPKTDSANTKKARTGFGSDWVL